MAQKQEADDIPLSHNYVLYVAYTITIAFTSGSPELQHSDSFDERARQGRNSSYLILLARHAREGFDDLKKYLMLRAGYGLHKTMGASY